ncbi:MAG TPA: TRAP transporter substrate-binding protein DctP [Quisquiliibacterium sp.]|nr:TRAP transporter substrate-binding protein DctP [Quisquiliibacterium sp.]
MKIRSLLAAVAAVFAVAQAPASAQMNWKLASAAQPGSPLLGFVEETVSKINAGSNGQIKVERLFIGSEQEIAQQIVRGRVELAGISMAGIAPLIPEAGLLTTPYLWNSDAERDYVTDNHALPVLRKIYEAKGVVLLKVSEVGWNDVACKKPCLSPNDVKGMKVRVGPAPSSKIFWSSVGVNGVQMPLSELFPALQSNLVEAADLPFPYYVTTPAAQSAPHYVTTRHLHHPSGFIINKRIWDGLNAEQRKVVMDAVPDTARMRKEVDASVKPKMDEFKAKGGFVHELTPAQRAEWSKLVIPNQEQMVKEAGGAAPELWAAIQKGKKEFAAKGGK